jgi:CHAT domain-containing protein
MLEALRTSQRVHVAAHGLFDEQNPGQSGILLNDGEGGHRTLTLRELRSQPMTQLQLATLATCHSAESALLPGGMRISLPSALLQAGALGVVASLWAVDDAASMELMTSFYHHLARKPAASALAAAQSEIHERNPKAPAEHWAGLVFYGND